MSIRRVAIVVMTGALVLGSAVARADMMAVALDSSASADMEMESLDGATCVDALATLRNERGLAIVSSDIEGERFVLASSGKNGAIAVLHCETEDLEDPGS